MTIYERKIINMALIYLEGFREEWINGDNGIEIFLCCMGKLYDPQGLRVDKSKLRKEILKTLTIEKAANPVRGTPGQLKRENGR